MGSDRVVVVGAGLAGLSAALRLAGAGREVLVLEASGGPGGLMGRWQAGDYTFDTGPTVLTMPELIDDALGAVGESRSDWLSLRRLAPSYTAHYPDGSVLRSYADEEAMAAELARVCGPDEAAGYRRLAAYLRQLYDVEFDRFMNRNLDSVAGLLGPEAVRLLRLGGLRGLDRVIGRYLADDRARRLFTFQALYAGVSPTRARALYAVISYLDSVAGVWFPDGGMHQVALALAGAAARHGVSFGYGRRVNRVEVSAGRARAVITADGERIPAGAVVVTADLAAAWAELLPAELRPRRLPRWQHSPSALVWLVGSRGQLPAPAHHTISFGRQWSASFDQIIRRGQLMADPSVLITEASATDPALAPAGRHAYYVLVPCPNLRRGRLDWDAIGEPYRAEIAGELGRRGFDDDGAFSTGIEVSRLTTPADWQRQGLTAGSPFGLAHTARQTGPLRPPTQHPSVANLLFAGAACQPGVGVPTVLLSGRLAAARLTG